MGGFKYRLISINVNYGFKRELVVHKFNLLPFFNSARGEEVPLEGNDLPLHLSIGGSPNANKQVKTMERWCFDINLNSDF